MEQDNKCINRGCYMNLFNNQVQLCNQQLALHAIQQTISTFFGKIK